MAGFRGFGIALLYSLFGLRHVSIASRHFLCSGLNFGLVHFTLMRLGFEILRLPYVTRLIGILVHTGIVVEWPGLSFAL